MYAQVSKSEYSVLICFTIIDYLCFKSVHSMYLSIAMYNLAHYYTSVLHEYYFQSAGTGRKLVRTIKGNGGCV